MLRGSDILVKNGVIDRIGRDLPLPEGCEVLVVSGMRIYPGLIAVSSSSILGREPPEHSTDVYGLNMVLALAGGLTTVVTGNTAAKLTYGTTEGMVIKRSLFSSMSYQRRSPQKRQELRRDLERVRRYMRDLADYEAQKSAGHEGLSEPDKKWLTGKYANYLKLLKGETKAKMALYTAQDILDACELAARFGFRLVIEGGTEAWTVANHIGQAGAQMIFTPRRKQYADPRKLKPSGWNIESARILHEHGINFAILPGSRGISLGGMTGRDLIALPMEAAFAVRGGLSDQAAIEAITIDAAKLLGLEKRLGSIEPGKDGDFVVCDGDLLHYNTLVQWTIVNGRIAYDKQKESLFAHIRPRDGSSGKVIEFWPRPADTMPDF
jgi:imidazolonepropionase-like amidohydrolase